MNEKKAQPKVTIDCPVCLSGNGFDLAQTDQELTCEDCGFLLAKTEQLKLLNSGRCVVCGNDRFYFDSFFNLKFFARASRCYVCEASYKGVKMTEPDAKHVDEVSNELRESDTAKRLRRRVDQWH
jgi:hypothetical protein